MYVSLPGASRGSVPNAAQLIRLSMTFTVWFFLKNVTRLGEKLVVLRESFTRSEFVPEWAEIEGFGGA